jgi:hypothetical protein
MKIDDVFDEYLEASYGRRVLRGTAQWFDLRDAFYAGLLAAVTAAAPDVTEAIAAHNKRAQERAERAERGRAGGPGQPGGKT